MFKNRKSDAPIFYDAKNTVLKILNADISVWDKVGGEYEMEPRYTWESTDLTTNILGNHSTQVESSNPDLENKFQIFEYGCISGKYSEKNCPIPPVFNPVNDQDTQLTGMGNVGCTITATNRSTGEVLGSSTVGADSRWTIQMEKPQLAGNLIDIVQDCQIEGCEPITVTQEVSHLAAKTVNYFKLGYWQDYGLILEGSIDNADWDLTDSSKVHKTLYLEDESGQVV